MDVGRSVGFLAVRTYDADSMVHGLCRFRAATRGGPRDLAVFDIDERDAVGQVGETCSAYDRLPISGVV